MIRRNLLYFMFYCLLTLSWLNGQEPAAIVLSVQGQAYFGNVSLCTGSVIRSGDSLRLSGKSQLRMLLRNGKVETQLRSGVFRSSPLTDSTLQTIFASSENIDRWYQLISVQPKTSVRASEEALTLVFPRNSSLLDKPAKLSWQTELDGPYECSLRCYEDDFSYDAECSQDNLVLMEDPFISEGKTYFWYARPLNTDLSALPPASWFKVLSQEDRTRLENELGLLTATLEADTASVAFKLLKCNILLNFELHHDVLTQLDEVLSVEPTNKVAHIYRALTCERMDLDMQSRNALQMVGRLSH